MSSRTRELKKKYAHKEFVARREPGKRTKLSYRPGVKMCLERASLLAESRKETEGQPEAIRQAKQLAKVLDNMTIFIFEDERIVGSDASSQVALPLYPEKHIEHLLYEVTEGSLSNTLDEQDKQKFMEVYHYWKGKSIDDRVRAVLPADLKPYLEVNEGVCETLHYRREKVGATPNYERVFKVGLNGLIKQIEDRLQELEEHKPSDMGAKQYIESRHFLEAMSISLKAGIRFANRFAALAREMMKSEASPQRRRELEQIAEACDWVPANPPRTFYEALQAWWFLRLICYFIETEWAGDGTRFDVLMYPYYKKDIEEGRLTREEAQELLEFLWLRLMEIGRITTPEAAAPAAGESKLQAVNLGGITAQGDDATNEVSFLMLDATIELQPVQPSLVLRYHPKINQELILRAIDCMRTGVGYPAIYNDSVIIPWFVNRGIPVEDARNYSIYICVQPGIPGKAMCTCGGPSMGVINLAKCLEIALHQGKDPIYGKQIGYTTPDPTTFRNIDDVIQAYLKQVNFVIGRMSQIHNIAMNVLQEYHQTPFTSALIDGCIETAQSCSKEFYRSFPIVTATGTVNVADSLAAIRKFVFDDKVVTMQELIEVLRNNFEGREDLRQELINKAPKFGNDDDYVDLIARDVFYRTQEEVRKFADVHGTPFTLDGSIAAAHALWGRKVGATPEGRKNKETLADGNGSPVTGRDKNGPTAVLKSLSKISPPPWPMLVNQKFLPQFLEGENRKMFAQYLKTFADLGIWHVQFNVVDRETLLNAQEHPENYGDLVVRVAGYSAYFVDIPRNLQDEIIARTTQAF